MEYNRQAYFRDDADDVTGFTIIEKDGDGLQIAENRDSGWVKYWMPADEFEARMSDDSAEYVGNLSSDQYLRVCEKVGVAEA